MENRFFRQITMGNYVTISAESTASLLVCTAQRRTLCHGSRAQDHQPGLAIKQASPSLGSYDQLPIQLQI
jgi:hypothetical protein